MIRKYNLRHRLIVYVLPILITTVLSCDHQLNLDPISEVRPLELEFIESRYIPVTVNYDATPEAEIIFYQTPDWLLPPVPTGYKWQRDNNNRPILLRHHLAPIHDIEVVIFGPDKNNKINFSAFIDKRLCQSFTNTRPYNDPFKDHGCPDRRRYPITEKDFDVYDYYLSLSEGRIYKEFIMRCMRGHSHDKFDTPEVGRILPMNCGPAWINKNPIPTTEIRTVYGRYQSNFDKRIFLPEPKRGWGENLRNHYVAGVRAVNGSYVQYPYYSTSPRLTENLTAVPDGVTFVGIKDPLWRTIEVFDVPWSHSYPTDKGIVDQYYLFDNFSDIYVPAPLVCKQNRSPHEISMHVNTLVAEANKYFVDRASIHRSYEKMLSCLSKARELEFFNPSNKLELAIGYGEYIVQPIEARLWLNMTEEHATFLDHQLDDKRIIFNDREHEDIVTSFQEECPGFEDPHDQKFDRFQQIYKNQQERRNS